MPTEPVVALLARQSRSSLMAMSDEIRQQIDSLSAQHRLIEAALTEKDSLARASQGSHTTPVANTGRGNKRELYVEILSQRPDRDWTPSEILAELERRGLPSNGAAVRVMLRRMAEDGRTVRTALGWRLASGGDPAENGAANGSSGPNSEALLFAAPPSHGADYESS